MPWEATTKTGADGFPDLTPHKRGYLPPFLPAREVAEAWAVWCGTENRWYKALMAFDAVGGRVQWWCGDPQSASSIPLTFALSGPDKGMLECNNRLRDIKAATRKLLMTKSD